MTRQQAATFPGDVTAAARSASALLAAAMIAFVVAFLVANPIIIVGLSLLGWPLGEWGGPLLITFLLLCLLGPPVLPRVTSKLRALTRAMDAAASVARDLWIAEWNAVGLGPCPASRSDCLKKLSTVQPTDRSVYLRAILEFSQGRPDTLRATLDSWVPGDPLAVARKAILEGVALRPIGDETGVKRATAAVAAIADGDDRRRAEATLAVLEASVLLGAGRSNWWRVFAEGLDGEDAG